MVDEKQTKLYARKIDTLISNWITESDAKPEKFLCSCRFSFLDNFFEVLRRTRKPSKNPRIFHLCCRVRMSYNRSERTIKIYELNAFKLTGNKSDLRNVQRYNAAIVIKFSPLENLQAHFDVEL